LARRLKPLVAAIRRDFPFDVIDAEFFFPDGPAAVALGKWFGVPVSIKARGADIHHWGHTSGTVAQICDAGHRAAGLLAVSEAMKRDMAAVGIPAWRITVHRTGVDLDRFAPCDRIPAKSAFGIAGPLIVSVGALIPRKGHDIVIEATSALRGATLLIAGEGAVPHGELPGLLAAADVMALASASEGLANAWVEALACGTPIVITDAGGAEEVVTDSAYGRIARRDSAAFAAAIADVLAAAPPQADVRRGAERFTWEANTAALYAHLRGLVRS
jgi:glycosyltransferase involved in cell wall biosynthesis